MLQIPQTFLRWLDEPAGEGLTLAGVRQVLALEDQIRQLEASLAAARAEVARLRAELAGARAGHDRMPARPNGRR